MKVKLLSGVCLGKDEAGHVIDGEPDKIYDVPDWLAKNLIGRNKAETVPDEKKPDGNGDIPIEEMKAGQLVKYAEDHNLDIGGLKPQAGKEAVLAAVLNAIKKRESGDE